MGLIRRPGNLPFIVPGIVIFFSCFLFFSFPANPVLGQDSSYEGDKDARPQETSSNLGAPGKKDAGLLSPQDRREIQNNLKKAENAKLNKTFTLDVGTGLNWNMWNFYDGFLNNLPGKRVGTQIDQLSMGLSIGFVASAKTAKLSVKMDMTAGLLNLKEFDGTFEPGLITAAYNSSIGVTPFQFGFGGPFYSEGPALSPLSAGNLNVESGSSRFLFERVPWDEANEPRRYYNNIYKNSGTVADNRQSGIGKPGIFLVLNPQAFDVSFFLAKSGTWSPIVKIARSLKIFDISLTYQDFNLDPDMSFRPLKSSHIGTIGLRRNTDRYIFNIEGGYSYGQVSSSFVTSNHLRIGQAGLLNFRTKKARLFIVDDLIFQLTGYYASRYYFGQGANAVKSQFSFANTNHYSFIPPVKTLGDFIGDSVSAFTYAQFKFLTGSVRLTYGAVSSFGETADAFKLPHDLGHKVWFLAASGMNGNYPAPGGSPIWADWDWMYEGATENYVVVNYGGTNVLSFQSTGDNPYAVPGGVIQTSKKSYAMGRLDCQYELSQLFNLPFPVYYFGRFIFSGIFVKNPVNLPFSTKGRVYDYLYTDHFVAVGLHPEFYLIGYVGTERNVLGGAGLLKTPVIMDGLGYGIGFDWFFKGGMGFYVKAQVLDQENPINPALGFKCWWINLELTKYFEY